MTSKTPPPNSSEESYRGAGLTYDLNADLVGRRQVRVSHSGQVSLDREDPTFFDNSAHLIVLRTDVRFRTHWEGMVEARMPSFPTSVSGAAARWSRFIGYLGDHLKLGAGYNFTDFSDDLTDLSYDQQGAFVNIIGTL